MSKRYVEQYEAEDGVSYIIDTLKDNQICEVEELVNEQDEEIKRLKELLSHFRHNYILKEKK